MKSFVRPLIAATVLTVTAAGVPAALAANAGDSEGCTPGYWKQSQHVGSWEEGIAPSDKFVVRFPGATGVASDLTLLAALQGGGGGGLEGARAILARAATAAYLNAANEDLEYPWRRDRTGHNGEPALVPTVVTAISGTDRGAMLALASQLDKANNLGCPLS